MSAPCPPTASTKTDASHADDEPASSSIIVCHSEEEWLAERMRSIGGSEGAQAIGESPYASPLDLYLLKTGQAEPFTGNEATKMGHLMEPIIDGRYQEETGRHTSDPGEWTIHRNLKYPFLHASIDRIVGPCQGHDGYGVGEYKNVGARMAEEWSGDEPPLIYQIQLQHNMAVMNFTWGSLAAIVGGQKLVWFDMNRNDAFIAHHIARIAEFWRCVQERTPPPAMGRDSRALSLLYPKQKKGLVIVLGEDGVQLTKIIDDRKEQIKVIDEEQRDAEAHLKEIMGDAAEARLPDGTGWSWKVVDTKAYDVAASSSRQLRRLKARKQRN